MKKKNETKTRIPKKNNIRFTHVVGVDEAGRGPLAGPVAVGVVVVPYGFEWDLISGVGDSKKVSPKNREAIFRRTKTLKSKHFLDYRVVLVSAKIIDTKGISYAVRYGIERTFKKLTLNTETTQVLLDGLLKAPPSFTHQETIIKGDAQEKVIGLASIMAKVTRDRYMEKIAQKYPDYAFEKHKGYGTKTHCGSIKKLGPCVEHRRTFISRII